LSLNQASPPHDPGLFFIWTLWVLGALGATGMILSVRVFLASFRSAKASR
jgi:hypothetical protein